MSAPEPYLYYNYPKECLNFHFDVDNETDDFIRVLQVSKPPVQLIFETLRFETFIRFIRVVTMQFFEFMNNEGPISTCEIQSYVIKSPP